MVLLINADNQIVKIGVFDGENIIVHENINADKNATVFQYKRQIKDVLSESNVSVECCDGAIISCVVPNLTETLKKAVWQIIGKEPVVLKAGIKTGLNIKLDNISFVGTDFICNCVGALTLFDSSLIVVDIGSVVCTSIIDDNKSFVGRTISAGQSLQLSALYSQAAQLFDVSLMEKAQLFGKNTSDAIRSGVVFGTAHMLNMQINKLKEQYPKAKIVVTGFEAETIKDYLEFDFDLEENLSLVGLKEIYLKNKK
ncbi:MAG: type III pantothenate kinase [Oscillospiraceae bacterium]